MKFLNYIIRKIKPKRTDKICLNDECHNYYKSLLKHNASIDTDNDINKMQYVLLRENHIIEKGLSMQTPKKGFGQKKVVELIAHIQSYYEKYGKQDFDFLIYPLSTIKEYISFTKESGVAIPEIETQYDKFLNYIHLEKERLTITAGVVNITREFVQNQSKGNFEEMMRSRHSIRYFDKIEPPREIIDKALEIAQLTPSACNRQGWHTHVFFNKDCHKLLTMQNGCNGFVENINCAILITADMNAFLSYETFQQYVDGGLYAMNLINALHYCGLGTIPLSCGFYHDKLDEIKRQFNIPENETMIVIVGTGILLESFKIAISNRKDIKKTNTYH